MAKEVVKAAEQQRKQGDGGDNEKKTAEAQRCTAGRKENTKGSNTVALGDKDKERRRDRSSEEKNVEGIPLEVPRKWCRPVMSSPS